MKTVKIKASLKRKIGVQKSMSIVSSNSEQSEILEP